MSQPMLNLHTFFPFTRFVCKWGTQQHVPPQWAHTVLCQGRDEVVQRLSIQSSGPSGVHVSNLIRSCFRQGWNVNVVERASGPEARHFCWTLWNIYLPKCWALFIYFFFFFKWKSKHSPVERTPQKIPSVLQHVTNGKKKKNPSTALQRK